MSEVTRPPIRLGRAVQEKLGISFSRAKREIERGRVAVNGQTVTDPGAIVDRDDVIVHNASLPAREARPRIEILYSDESVVVANKPAGLLVHPTLEREKDTLVRRTADELQRRTGRRAPLWVVHRIDRDTSGIVVLARSPRAASFLQSQFRAHAVERRYRLIAVGDIKREVVVDRPIGRPEPGARREVITVARGGRSARTVVRPIERFGAETLVEAALHTGRTHQIRVHMAWLGHPVLGDALYGDPSKDPVEAPRLALHASLIEFRRPRAEEPVRVEAPFPDDLGELLRALQRS